MPQHYADLAREAAIKYKIDPNIFIAQLNQESRFDPRAVSSEGAVGLGQIMPLHVDHPEKPLVTWRGNAYTPGDWRTDPESNIDYAAFYLSKQLDTFGTYALALAAYNAGPGNVIQAGRQIPPFPETVGYVNRILQTSALDQYGLGPSPRPPQFVEAREPSVVEDPLGENVRMGAPRAAYRLDEPIIGPSHQAPVNPLLDLRSLHPRRPPAYSRIRDMALHSGLLNNFSPLRQAQLAVLDFAAEQEGNKRKIGDHLSRLGALIKDPSLRALHDFSAEEE